MKHSRVNHSSLKKALTVFAGLRASDPDAASVPELDAAVVRWERNRFDIVVVGEVKRGKSSLINALLETSGFVPVADHVATSTAFVIEAGRTPAYRVVFFPKDGGNAPSALDISATEIDAYGTEAGNPHNVRGVDRIECRHPSPLLAKGLRFIDLPGLGGVLREHTQVAWRYLPQADVVVFVTDSLDGMLSKAEAHVITAMRPITERFMFVQTKTDLAGRKLAEATRNYNMSCLSELFPEQHAIPYFLVSSRHQLDETPERRAVSGFHPLLDYLHDDVVATKRDALAQPVITVLEGLASGMRSSLLERLAIVKAADEEKLTALAAAVAQVAGRLNHWSMHERPRIQRNLDHALLQARTDMFNDLVTRIDPSMGHGIVGELVGGLERQEGLTAKAVVEAASFLHDQAVSRCAGILKSLCETYQGGVEAACRDAAGIIGHDLEKAFTPLKSPLLHLNDPRAITVSGGMVDFVRSVSVGTGTGASVGALAVALVAVAFPPAAVLTSVMTGVGATFGALDSIVTSTERRRSEALAQLRSSLSETVRVIQLQARTELQKQVTAQELRIKDVVEQAIRRKVAALEASRKEIEQRKTQTLDEARAREEQLSLPLKEAESVLALLAAARNGGAGFDAAAAGGSP